MRRLLATAMVALAAMLAAGPAWAQFETAAVVGTVRDSSGAVVVDATITLLNPDTGVSVKRVMSYGQSVSSQTPIFATLLIPSRIDAPLSLPIVPSTARSL